MCLFHHWLQCLKVIQVFPSFHFQMKIQERKKRFVHYKVLLHNWHIECAAWTAALKTCFEEHVWCSGESSFLPSAGLKFNSGPTSIYIKDVLLVHGSQPSLRVFLLPLWFSTFLRKTNIFKSQFDPDRERHQTSARAEVVSSLNTVIYIHNGQQNWWDTNLPLPNNVDLSCFSADCTDHSPYTTLNWGARGVREFMLDIE